MSLKVGDIFTSFKEIHEALEKFKAETNTDFYTEDSRLLESAKKRAPRVANSPEELKYYYIKYKCIHGGEARKRKDSKGLRNVSTLRMGCKAFIHFNMSEDCKSLFISNLHLEHNHDTSEPLFVEVPTHKKRNQRLRVKVADLNTIKKKKISEHVSQNTEEASLEWDLRNINSSNPDVQNKKSDETEVMHNSVHKATHSFPEGEALKPSEHDLCKCGIGTFDLTKQDLLKMEVEEHYHRLEVLQLQKIYEAERIENMRRLYDLKIRLAERELQSCNFKN